MVAAIIGFGGPILSLIFVAIANTTRNKKVAVLMSVLSAFTALIPDALTLVDEGVTAVGIYLALNRALSRHVEITKTANEVIADRETIKAQRGTQEAEEAKVRMQQNVRKIATQITQNANQNKQKNVQGDNNDLDSFKWSK